ncbi:hypothetical protein OsJ_01550 [Oryza sativa Japonica Group]|uniref:Plant heme peroxidase family profile domain-containing protein n=1 Tax=Oryza sativa subsp. japonica TaxID=39947 RepID=B9EW51_ORYSJ|nr:hypothetical protein OsJ_01550 [Oryza sativa Japonica Group]
MASCSKWLAGLMLLAAALACSLPAASRAQLQVGFYNTSCPTAEALVRQAVVAAVANNSGLAAGLIRLHFHDCFVRVPAGRRDGNVSIDTDAFTLPGPNLTATQLVDGFKLRNLTAEEMVILSGSHTIGRSHCASFLFKNRERLANGTISPAYQALLEALCPPTTGRFTPITTEIDVSTPATLDNNYYKLLPLNLGLHFSDDQLIRNATLLPFVDAFAANETLWKEKFVAAMIKMGNIDVLTGARGEIRLNCSAVNPSSSSSSSSAGRMIETVFPGAGGEVAAS